MVKMLKDLLWSKKIMSHPEVEEEEVEDSEETEEEKEELGEVIEVEIEELIEVIEEIEVIEVETEAEVKDLKEKDKNLLKVNKSVKKLLLMPLLLPTLHQLMLLKNENSEHYPFYYKRA